MGVLDADVRRQATILSTCGEGDDDFLVEQGNTMFVDVSLQRLFDFTLLELNLHN